MNRQSLVYITSPQNYNKVEGSPIAYWLNPSLFFVFDEYQTLRKRNEMKKGTSTGDNERFMRQWSEVSFDKFKSDCATPEEAAESKKNGFQLIQEARQENGTEIEPMLLIGKMMALK